MANEHGQSLFCRTLHHANGGIQPGDPVEPSIVPASVYFLPGERTARKCGPAHREVRRHGN